MDEFEDAAGEFLLADPVRNTVLLTVVASLRVSGADAYGDDPPYFSWYDDFGVKAAFLRTPPMPAIVSDAPADAMQSLVDVVAGVPGLRGPSGGMRAFADAWHAATDREAKVASNSGLFRLEDLPLRSRCLPAVPGWPGPPIAGC